MEDDPDLIAIIATDGHENSFQVITQRENEKWCLPAEIPIITRDRPGTPGPDEIFPEPSSRWVYYSRIELRFDNLPSDGLKFGTSPESHIQLRTQRQPAHHKASETHFRITYDEDGNLVLQDQSINGTIVNWNGQNGNELRRHFTWILDIPGSEDDFMERTVYVPDMSGMRFNIIVPNHKNCTAEYERKRQIFLDQRRLTIPSFDAVNIFSGQTTQKSSYAETLGNKPIYYKSGLIAEGGCGKVTLVYDISTRIAYAKKKLSRYTETGAEALCREARFMQNLDHRHLVSLKSFSSDPSPTLMMPYYSLGNLHDQNNKSKITLNEINLVFHQTLLALEYLHSEKVTHRDLKPGNILVETRAPLIIIRLSDFGISKYGDDLVTIFGTPAYMAPEIYEGRYTSAVDLWSLGIVIMQYAHYLPWHSAPILNEEASVQCWCDEMVKIMRHWELNPTKKMVSKLLMIDPKVRLSATQCLQMGYTFGIFAEYEGMPLRTGKIPLMETNDDGGSTQQRLPGTEPHQHDIERTLRPFNCEQTTQPTIILPQKLPSPCGEQAQSNGLACMEVIQNTNHEDMIPTQEIPWTHLALNRIELARKPKFTSSNPAFVDVRNGGAILPTAVSNAVRRGLMDDDTGYFQLPFHNGDVRIRKKDRRVHLTGALTEAGINRSEIAKLHGRKYRNTSRVSKRSNYQRNHIKLETAMRYAKKHDKVELYLLLHNFMVAYRSQVKKEDAPPNN